MKQHQYHVTLTHITDTDGNTVEEFNAPNHDDLFTVLDKVRQKQPEIEQEILYRFVVGLKMMNEVVLENRKHEFFAQFSPSIREIMMILKGKKGEINENP